MTTFVIIVLVVGYVFLLLVIQDLYIKLGHANHRIDMQGEDLRRMWERLQ